MAETNAQMNAKTPRLCSAKVTRVASTSPESLFGLGDDADGHADDAELPAFGDANGTGRAAVTCREGEALADGFAAPFTLTSGGGGL
jgi:hypothetical protein